MGLVDGNVVRVFARLRLIGAQIESKVRMLLKISNHLVPEGIRRPIYTVGMLNCKLFTRL